MNKYAVLALKAVEKTKSERITPIVAWEESALEVFPTSPSSREKGCPKGTFLGLCEEGLIKGIPAGHYTRSTKNKQYAMNAVDYIESHGMTEKSLLWRAASGGDKAHNSQMDIVIELWKANLINY